MSETAISVLYTCDRNNFTLTLYSIASLARSHKNALHINFIQQNFCENPAAAYCTRIEECGHQLFIHRIMPESKFVPSRSGFTGGHISKAAMFKPLAIEMLASKYKYLLYLDSDILIFDDLHLESFQFNFPLAAVMDFPTISDQYDPYFTANCEKNHVTKKYFNSGMMMINTDEWKEKRYYSLFYKMFELHERKCPYFANCTHFDQCLFNMLAKGEFFGMPIDMNVQKCALHTKYWNVAKIRHYTGGVKFLTWKPWIRDMREFRLLKNINSEFGLSEFKSVNDYGISNFLNSIRRKKDINMYENIIDNLARTQ